MSTTQIGPYQIIRECSQENFGQCYRALDQTRNKQVLLTDCRPEWVSEGVLRRLQSEAKTFARLSHPNIARIFGFICRDEHLYLVTELVEGRTLEEILAERRRMPPAMVVTLFRQLAAGLAAGHRLGVVHGNLKPSNIVVPDHGPIKILNFTLTHIFGCDARIGGKASRYLAPEQIEGELPDVRSDIYSLGLMLYEAVVGVGPFDAYGVCDNGVEAAQTQFIPLPPSLLVSEIPSWLDHFLLQMLAPAPANRYQSVKAATRALEAGAEDLENPSKQRKTWKRFKAPWAVRESAFSPARVLAGVEHVFAEPTLRMLKNAVAYTSPVFSANSKVAFHSVDWRKYVQVTALIILIAAETFYFRGANISLLLDAASQSKPSLNDSVDAMFARIDREPKNDPQVIRNVDPTRVIEPKKQNLSAIAKPAMPPAIDYSEPLPKPSAVRSQRPSLIELPRERDANVLPVQRPNIKESNAPDPVIITHNKTNGSTLNVKWEN